MSVVHSVLIADGTSDRMLIPILQRLLAELAPDTAFSDVTFADVRGGSLTERVSQALVKYPCSLLFVHRDAERQDPEIRYLEIDSCLPMLQADQVIVAIVPVKMTEAWLITDEIAVRKSVGNRSGTTDLGLPELKRIEQCEAKSVLDAALTKAVDLDKRRRGRFRPEEYRTRVAELLTSLDPLRSLPSFRRLEEQLVKVLPSIIEP